MPEYVCQIPVPSTPQALDQAIQRYKDSDLSGLDLFCQWQAIRDASLEKNLSQAESDQVSGEDSY
jgi:hypothetical protein